MKLRKHRLLALLLGQRRIKLDPWPFKHAHCWPVAALEACAAEGALPPAPLTHSNRVAAFLAVPGITPGTVAQTHKK